MYGGGFTFLDVLEADDDVAEFLLDLWEGVVCVVVHASCGTTLIQNAE